MLSLSELKNNAVRIRYDVYDIEILDYLQEYLRNYFSDEVNVEISIPHDDTCVGRVYIEGVLKNDKKALISLYQKAGVKYLTAKNVRGTHILDDEVVTYIFNNILCTNYIDHVWDSARVIFYCNNSI